MVTVASRFHVHVDSGIDGTFRRLCRGGGVAMRLHLANRPPVTHDKSVELPFLPRIVVSSNVLPELGTPPISLNDAMRVPAPASTAALNGGKIDIPERSLGYVDGVVPPSLSATIGRVVFSAVHDTRRSAMSRP